MREALEDLLLQRLVTDRPVDQLTGDEHRRVDLRAVDREPHGLAKARQQPATSLFQVLPDTRIVEVLRVLGRERGFEWLLLKMQDDAREYERILSRKVEVSSKPEAAANHIRSKRSKVGCVDQSKIEPLQTLDVLPGASREQAYGRVDISEAVVVSRDPSKLSELLLQPLLKLPALAMTATQGLERLAEAERGHHELR